MWIAEGRKTIRGFGRLDDDSPHQKNRGYREETLSLVSTLDKIEEQ